MRQKKIPHRVHVVVSEWLVMDAVMRYCRCAEANETQPNQPQNINGDPEVVRSSFKTIEHRKLKKKNDEQRAHVHVIFQIQNPARNDLFGLEISLRGRAFHFQVRVQSTDIKGVAF